MSHSSRRVSCPLIWVVVALVAIILLGVVLLPWWMKMSEYSEITDTAVERISRYQRLLASRSVFEDQQRLLQKKLKERNYFIFAESPELAAAEIQKRAKTLVGQSGGNLMSTQYLGLDKEHERIVRVKVRMKGDVRSLQAVLFELESALPVLKVDNLSVRSRKTVKGRGKNRVEGYSLDITFVISGFMARSAS